MTEDSTSTRRQQLEILDELVRMNTEERITISDVSPLFFCIAQSIADDWKQGSWTERMLLLVIYASLPFFLLTSF